MIPRELSFHICKLNWIIKFHSPNIYKSLKKWRQLLTYQGGLSQAYPPPLYSLCIYVYMTYLSHNTYTSLIDKRSRHRICISTDFSFIIAVSSTFLVSSLFIFLLHLIIRIYKDRSEVIKKFLSDNLMMSYLVLSPAQYNDRKVIYYHYHTYQLSQSDIAKFLLC